MIAERPKVGAYAGYAGTTANALNAYVMIGDRTAVFNLASNAGNWPAHQCVAGAYGQGRDTIVSLANDGNWAYPDDPTGGSWSNIGSFWLFQKSHGNLNPAHRAVWTAPANYEKIAVLCNTFSTFDPACGVALSGTGTLLHATLKTDTGSPFEDLTPVDQKFLLLAEDVLTGDTLTFTPQDGELVRLVGIVAWNESSVEAPSASNENLVLHEGVTQDGYEPDTFLIGALTSTMSLGNTLAIKAKDALNAANWWGSQAHSSATHRLESTSDVFRYKPYGSAEQDWAPSVGDRVEGEYVKVTTSGDVRMFNFVVGTYTQTFLISDDGVHVTWTITWNAQAVANGVEITGGYHTMFRMSDAPIFMHSLGGLRQALVLDDNSLTAVQPCDIVRYYGGDLGGMEIRCHDVPTIRTLGAKTILQERSDGSNKHYVQLVPYESAPLAAVEGETFSSEAHYLVRAAEPVDHGVLEVGRSLSMATL